MRISLLGLGLLLLAPHAWSADDPATIEFFESRIRPVLANECYECHSAEAGKSKGGLLLDSRHAVRTGGDSGPAVFPGSPGESLLLTAINHDDPDLEMPPKKAKLSDRVIADFRDWIAKGAVDPRESQLAGSTFSEVEMEQRKQHWSYQPITKPESPKTKSDWAQTEIDRFVLAKLEENQLTPSPNADPVTLLRRLHFDLTGLPPSPEEVAAFKLEDLESVVDELLNSKDFGAKWARHWLDVARFAESNGRESNIIYPYAWRYRDYVIDALNADIPYDRFLTEQIAGDLLPADSEAERARLLIATGFLAVGAKGLNEQNKAQFAADVVDEQIDATTRAVLGSSIACARCHDHKSDPFTMTDYYGLAGIFKSTRTHFGTYIDSENNNGGTLIQLPDLPGQLISHKGVRKDKVDKWKAELAELKRQEEEGKAKAEKAKSEGVDMRDQFNDMLREALRIYWTRGRLNGQLAQYDDEGNPLPLCMGVEEKESMVNSPTYERGEIAHPGPEVPRGIPDTFSLKLEIPEDESGRLQFAEWITSADNPLTARVMANRVWQHLLGTGLVRTVDNFGPTGEAPTHPELLDYLATRFQEQGWSVKELIREIVLSHTYRQSSQYRADAYQTDPDNRLLWRANQRRLDAEAIRDAMLQVAGNLDTSRRPGSLVADMRSVSVSMVGFQKDLPEDLDGSNYRSVYLPVLRDNLPDVLYLFDFAEPSLVTGSRDETNVPLQALYMMNSEFIHTQAESLAQRLIAEDSTSEGRIQLAYQLCFNRNPDPAEADLIQGFFAETPDADELHQWTLFCQSLLASAEFRIAY